MAMLMIATTLPAQSRPRLRDLGVTIGTMPPGPLNGITDVEGVRVGHTTLIRGDNIRTGVTAILPHSGNLFKQKVPAAVFVGNAFGKIMGTTQIEELGEIETPILLTSTLNVPRVADALLDFMLALPGNEQVRSINPVVAETNDGRLNDNRSRPVGRDEVFHALQTASAGAVEEGSVGSGTGTTALGFKGGIGTASRRPVGVRYPYPNPLPGGYTLGVLVQTNFSGDLTIAGVPVGRELSRAIPRRGDGMTPGAYGSCIIVIATDAPIDARNLKRIAKHAIMGLARTGGMMYNSSGDYVIAFSTARDAAGYMPNDWMDVFFEATIEATEEAIINSLLRATTVTGNGRTVEALPIEATKDILRRHNAIR